MRAVLHPYLHWTSADGHTVRGRNNVLAALSEAPPTAPPAHHELRDDQIYRWVE